MDAKTYVKNVLVTESNNFDAIRARMTDKNLRLIHAAAGISSEISEIIELADNLAVVFNGESLDRTNLMEEGSDLLWYLGIACDVLDCTEKVTNSMDFIADKIDDDIVLQESIREASIRLALFAGEFQDLVIKKTCFYGKTVKDEDLSDLLARIHETVSILCNEAGYTVEEARERNIAKLKARYGDKFTEAAALERNLKAERRVLESK